MPPDLLPNSMTLKNYSILLSNSIVMLFAVNTFVYSITSALLSMAFCVVTSYFILFGESKTSKFLFYLLGVTLIIPRFALIIPQYVLLSRVSLLDTIYAVCVPIVYNVSGVYICKAYMETVPKAFYETAQIDGAGNLRILTSVIMPLCKPVLAAIGIFQAIGSAGDFLWQTLVISDKAKNTLIAGLPLLIRENIWADALNVGKPIGLSIASSVIMFIPLLMYFIVGNKFYRKLDMSYKE